MPFIVLTCAVLLIFALFVESRVSQTGVDAAPRSSLARRSLSRRGAIDLEVRAA